MIKKNDQITVIAKRIKWAVKEKIQPYGVIDEFLI